MTINEIKKELGIETLELNKSTNQEGVFTGWYRNWNDTKRVQISVHEDTVKKMAEDSAISNLGLQTEEKTSPTSGKPYTNKRIIMYQEAEYSF